MYYQIKIAENNQDALHLVWTDNTHKEVMDHIIKVHMFGKIDSPPLQIGLLKGQLPTNQPSMKIKL